MNIPLITTVGTSETLLLMRNLAMTLHAGIPLARALQLFEEEAPRGSKSLISSIRKSVEGGNTLTHAMENAPRKFPDIAINLVKAGEQAGTLEESLNTISMYLRKRKELVRKIRSAMMYPTFVLFAVFGLGMAIGLLVLPELIPLFESIDVELPMTTKILLWFAALFEKYGFLIAGSIILFFVALYVITRLEFVKPLWHRILLLIPYVGKIQRQAAIAQITRTLSTLLKSGIPIKEAIPSAAYATENRVYRHALLATLPVIESGRTLHEGLKNAGKTFPGMTTTMVDIGEETGTMTETLGYLSEYYEGEVDHSLKDLTTALEPILLIIIGVIVGGTVLAIITPIYDVTGSLG